MGSSISTYGMVGVGIAAAIGFVFALTILNNSNAPLDTTQRDGQELAQQRRVETQPAAPSSFLVEQQQQEVPPTTTGQRGEEDGSDSSAARLSKEQSRDTGGADSAGQEETTLLLQEQPAATTTESLPALSSLTAVNGTSRQVIGEEVTPGMAFAAGRPVFFKANFVNPSETEIINHTIIMNLARNGSSEASQTDKATMSYERAANFQGDIGANGSVKLELYWNPDIEGEYVLSVLSLAPSDLSDQDSVEPLLSIAIKAKEE
jgi:hypothetical protein